MLLTYNCTDNLTRGPHGRLAGSEYHVADPDRPIPENFDEIFAINDERRMKELMDWDGTTSLDDLKIANRSGP